MILLALFTDQRKMILSTCVIITLIRRYECVYKLYYEKTGASQIFLNSIHYFNLRASNNSIVIILLIVVRVSSRK